MEILEKKVITPMIYVNPVNMIAVRIVAYIAVIYPPMPYLCHMGIHATIDATPRPLEGVRASSRPSGSIGSALHYAGKQHFGPWVVYQYPPNVSSHLLHQTLLPSNANAVPPKMDY